jgi:hypothetical protein
MHKFKQKKAILAMQNTDVNWRSGFSIGHIPFFCRTKVAENLKLNYWQLLN